MSRERRFTWLEFDYILKLQAAATAQINELQSYVRFDLRVSMFQPFLLHTRNACARKKNHSLKMCEQNDESRLK